MYIALDEVVDILERQMVKYRKRIKEKARRDVSFKEELRLVPDGYDIPAESDDGEIIIDKTKKFAMKPIDAEEAVVEMEMLNHTFYVFRNRETDEVNVVYKRKNGTYGIIEPEN
jgi:putative sigma-54 modulation protein